MPPPHVPAAVPAPLRAVAVAHPFPSALNALAAGSLALVAGADLSRAALLAGSMLLLQVSIGAANDVLDVPYDRQVKLGKPIPAGIVSARSAAALALGAMAAGLGLALAIGVGVGLIAIAGLAAGLAYDVGLKRTALSWVPFAVGLPLVPAFAWVAARGDLPRGFPVLIAIAILAGAEVALANGLVDADDDVRSGAGGLVVRLGGTAASRILPVLAVAIGAAALVSGFLIAPAGGRMPGMAIVAGGVVALLGGTALSRSPDSARLREAGWDVQAIALAAVALGWLLATNVD